MKKKLWCLFCLALLPWFGLSAADKPWLAVHDFTVAPELTKEGVTAWGVAEEMENRLTKSGRFRLLTRVKIAKVLKEKNISASDSISPADLGKMIQANFIVTGELKRQGERLIMIAKMLDVTQEAGEVEKSFDAWMFDMPGEKISEPVSVLIETLANKLTMTPGEFLELGISKMKQKDYETAFESFQEMVRIVPADKIRKIVGDIRNNPPPDSKLDIPSNPQEAGQMFDKAIDLLAAGDTKAAGKMLWAIQRNKDVGDLLKLNEIAKSLFKNNSEKLELALEESSRKYLSAVKNRQQQEKDKDPRQLCDEALNPLNELLNDKSFYLSPMTRRRIEQLVGKIETLKKTMYGGPSAEGMWVIPEIELVMLPVKAGVLTGQPGADPKNPKIRYKAKLTKPFWIGKFEVTLHQFTYYLNSLKINNKKDRYQIEKELNIGEDVCPLTEDYQIKPGQGATWGDPAMPMTGITWQGANMFCKWLTESERTAKRLPPGYLYRLPTEAEWEYACRAGTDNKYYYGNDMEQLGDYGWFVENSGGAVHPAGQKKPNAWGLYDTAGNVWEWCSDWSDENFLNFDSENPKGPKSSVDNTKVLRGGSFTSGAEDLQASARYNYDYKAFRKNIGFRVVCAPAN
jgi:formylglycine-generating enzyme required for sulfatase activity/TolB-like protein